MRRSTADSPAGTRARLTAARSRPWAMTPSRPARSPAARAAPGTRCSRLQSPPARDHAATSRALTRTARPLLRARPLLSLLSPLNPLNPLRLLNPSDSLDPVGSPAPLARASAGAGRRRGPERSAEPGAFCTAGSGPGARGEAESPSSSRRARSCTTTAPSGHRSPARPAPTAVRARTSHQPARVLVSMTVSLAVSLTGDSAPPPAGQIRQRRWISPCHGPSTGASCRARRVMTAGRIVWTPRRAAAAGSSMRKVATIGSRTRQSPADCSSTGPMSLMSRSYRLRRRSFRALAGLSVLGVLAAASTELLDGEPIGGVPTVLLRDVVALLALRASQSDLGANVAGLASHGSLL